MISIIVGNQIQISGGSHYYSVLFCQFCKQRVACLRISVSQQVFSEASKKIKMTFLVIIYTLSCQVTIQHKKYIWIFLGSSKSSLREEFSFAYNEEGYKQTKKQIIKYFLYQISRQGVCFVNDRIISLNHQARYLQ